MMMPHERAKQAPPLRTDRDRRIIDALAVALIKVGDDDDLEH